MLSPRCGALALLAAAGAARAETTTIYKVDYPEVGFCGQEANITKSNLNPHWFFPMTFGGFSEGHCSDVGYTKFKEKKVVEMHPVPWVHHNLTFDIYAPTQSKTITIELVDDARQGRKVKAKFCMPAGDGRWPLYIFGHGAGCDAEDYEYFCQKVATAMVYQDSAAGPIFPADFDSYGAAKDAAFLAGKLPAAAKDASSPLYGHFDGTVIMGGHSMGGAMSVISMGREHAAADGMAVFAPGLYTHPNASPFLGKITAPSLVVSGGTDCGANQLEKEAQPAYDGLASPKKVLVVLRGANHCQWIQPFEKGIGICSTFEKNECHGISRARQHRLGVRLLSAFAAALASEQAWAALEMDLAAAEASGILTYVSSSTSPAGKRLHSDCPCSSAASNESMLVI